MTRVLWSSAASAVAIVALLALSMPGATAPLSSPHTVAHAASLGAAPVLHPSELVQLGSSGPGSSHPSAVPPIRPSPSLWNNSPACRAKSAAYNATYGDLVRPRDVLRSEQSPCYIGHDEPGLNFVSNASGSGSRVEFQVSLPNGKTNTASAFSTFWVGMWLSGVSCSYRGQSYLEVQLNPPYNVVNNESNGNWTVQAPAWDLVPAGSCDPQCQNDTAFATIGGLPYCEDDSALTGVGSYRPNGWGNFSPGDQLVIDLVGSVSSSTGLTVYLNDTTRPSRSLNWTYSAAVSTSGKPLNPFYDASTPDAGGWGYGLNVEATWENCPEEAGLTPCNSYNGPAVNAVNVPWVTSATFWNSTSHTYANQFSQFATTSSAGACSGLAAPCFDYSTFGGTGFYPFWSVHAWGGKSWWTYGGTYPYEVNNFGQAAQFNPLGFVPVWDNPTTISKVSNSTSVTTLSVTAQVADPSGVRAVNLTAFWCSGTSTSPQVLHALAGSLGAGPDNTSFSGNWSLSLPTGGFVGTMHYWVTAQSATGVWSAPVYDTASIVTGGSGSCAATAPATPSMTLSDVTPIGGGYRLNWTEPSAGIKNYTLWFNATSNGTPFSVDVGPSVPVTVPLFWDNQSFNISIVAWNEADLRSATSAPLLAPKTLFSLAPVLQGPVGTIFWVHQAVLAFNASVTGGMGPFTYTFIFSDGTTQTVFSPLRTLTVTHDFGGYFGVARVSFQINDSLGDEAASNRQLIQIWATPLGTPQTIAAGDSFVNITWSPAASPAAPVSHYTVFYTQNPLWAYALTQFWPYNTTGPYYTFLWNTTLHYLELPVPDGTTLYAQVVAWNLYGEGQLANGTNYLQATPAQLIAGPIQPTSTGGPAPLIDQFSTMVTGGTNDTITSSLYSFPGGATVVPTIQGSNGILWLNGSYTFPSPGHQIVVLHANDAFGDTAIQTLDVFVSPSAGPPPLIVLGSNLTNSQGWVGVPVDFTATVSGTTGNLSYAWQFGDGNNSTEQNPIHTYALPGAYTVSVSVNSTSAPTQFWTQTKLVSIFALPAVAISTAQGPAGALSLTFTAIYSGGFGHPKFEWTFGDGQLGQGAVATHNYSSSGVYSVQVIATDSSQRTATSSVTLQVGSGSGSSSSGSVNFGGTNGILIAGLAILAVVFLLGMIYFWSQARRSPVVMAPEPTERLPPTGATAPERPGPDWQESER